MATGYPDVHCLVDLIRFEDKIPHGLVVPDVSAPRQFQREYRSPILVHPYALTLLGDDLSQLQESCILWILGFKLMVGAHNYSK